MRHSPASNRQPLVIAWACVRSGKTPPFPPVSTTWVRTVALSPLISICSGPVLRRTIELRSICRRSMLCSATRSIPSLPTKSDATAPMKSPARRSLAATCICAIWARNAASGVSCLQADSSASKSSSRISGGVRKTCCRFTSNGFAFPIRSGMLARWNPTVVTRNLCVTQPNRTPWGGSAR